MSQKLNQLVDLSRLRDSGSISEDEYTRLKNEVMASGTSEPTTEGSEEPTRFAVAWEQAKQIAVEYPRVVGTAAGVVIVLLMMFVYMTGDHGSGQEGPTPVAEPAPDPVTGLPEDSLGVEFSEMATLWNGLEQPPIVDGGIARSPETGPFDSFSHKFDESSVLAGAYDPADDAVYAVMVRTSLTDPDINNMYLHVCFMLHPFSPECIADFWEKGMDEASFADYLEEDHFSTWEFEGNEWRLEIEDGVQTLRVISPGSARVVS